jgi:hypothetical protein
LVGLTGLAGAALDQLIVHGLQMLASLYVPKTCP